MSVSVRKRYKRRKLQRKEKKEKKIVFGKFFELYFILFSTQGKVSLTFRYRRFPLLRKGQTPSAQERCVTHENPEEEGSTVYHWRRKKKSYKVRWVLALQFQVFSQNKILRKPEILHGTIRLNQQYLLHWSILTIMFFFYSEMPPIWYSEIAKEYPSNHFPAHGYLTTATIFQGKAQINTFSKP